MGQAEIDQYREDGYVIPKDFRLPGHVIERIKEDHARLLRDHPEFSDYCGALLAFDLTFLNHARNPDILGMVKQLIGEDVALWNQSFFAKPPRTGRRVPWHQYGAYWCMRPL